MNRESRQWTAQITKIYDSLISRELLLEEQKRSCKETRLTGELLYIDELILKDRKSKGKI